MQLRDYIDSGELQDVYIVSLGGGQFMIKVHEVTKDREDNMVEIEASWPIFNHVRHLVRSADEEVYIEIEPRRGR